MATSARQHKPKRIAKQYTLAKRDRFYDHARWLRLRRLVLARDALCRACRRRGFTVPAVHVDHVIQRDKRPDLAYAAQNCQGLCASCHTRKTNREHGQQCDHRTAVRVQEHEHACADCGADMPKPKRIIVTGPPNSGKTTYVEHHREIGDVVWDYDAIARTMTGHGRHQSPEYMIPLFDRMRAAIVAWAIECEPSCTVWIITANDKVAVELAQQLDGAVLRQEMRRCE